jgi:hypothetical protein
MICYTHIISKKKEREKKNIVVLIYYFFYQLLFGSMVIGAEFGMEHHDLISATSIERVLKPFDAKTDFKIKLNWW